MAPFDDLVTGEADVGFELALPVAADVAELGVEVAVEELVRRHPDAQPPTGFEPIEDLAEHALVVLDVLEHIDHHRRPERRLGRNLADDACDRGHPSIVGVAIGEQRGCVGAGFDGGDVAERGVALGERAVARTDLEDRSDEVRRAQVDDPVPVVECIVERVERGRQCCIDLAGIERRARRRIGR